MEYRDIVSLLKEIAKNGTLSKLEELYRKHVFGKTFRFIDWDVKMIVSWALTGFVKNDYVTHRVFVKYLFEIVLAGYGDTICFVCRDSHRVFTENFPRVAGFILSYAYLSPPDTHLSKMVCKLRRYPM